MKGKRVAAIIALVFFISLLINNNIEMPFDESRHAMQSVFFKQYFATILSGDYISLPEFLNLQMQKNQYVGWFALYDPPVHAIIGGIFFLIFGISQFVAMASNALVISATSLVFYLMSRDYFQDEKKALVCYALFLFNPFVFQWSRIYRTELFVTFTFAAWYYFTFWRKEKYLSIRLGHKLAFRVPLMVLLGGIFLTLSGLSKYPSIIFAACMMITHFLYSMYVNRSIIKEESFLAFAEKANLWMLIKKYTIQAAIFLVIGGWWIKFSLFDYGMWSKALWAGTEVGRTRSDLAYYVYYPVALFQDVYYITAFALIAIYLAFKVLDSRKILLTFSCLSVLLVATILISNRQLRYTFQFTPMFYLLSVDGLFLFANWIKRYLKFHYIFLAMAFFVFFVYTDYVKTRTALDVTGHIDYGIEKFMANVKDPSYFMNIKGHGGFEASRVVNGYQYKYTPDLFNFKLVKVSKNYDDPKKMQRYVDIVYWVEEGFDTHPEVVIHKLVDLSKQIDVYLVLYRFDDPKTDNIISSLKQPLMDAGFSYKEFDYYIVLYKVK